MEMTAVGGYSPAFVEQVRADRARRNAELVAEQDKLAAIDILKRRKVSKWAGDIILTTCREHGVSPVDLLTGSRKYRVVDCRHETIYRVKAAKPASSCPRIGGWFGIDHTTVLHGLANYSHQTGEPKLTTYKLRTGKGKRPFGVMNRGSSAIRKET